MCVVWVRIIKKKWCYVTRSQKWGGDGDGDG